MEPEKLCDLKEYGQSILQRLDSVPQNPSQHEDWVPATFDECLIRLREAASKTVELATSPVKIGVMGEFSSGKSLLLGSLIGYADALPVSANPTTGNITALHIIQQEDFQTTKVDKFTVEYLSHDGVRDCLSFMLREAEKRAIAAGLPLAQLATLKSLNLKDIKDIEVWNRILSWSEEVWNSTPNLELRYLLRELVLFARIYISYGAAMCGQRYPIDGNTALEGLKLPDMPMAIQTLSFNSLPSAPMKLPKPPLQLLAKLLQNSFPLIRRIDIEVRLSKEIWNLSAVQGTSEFILLDFPGLGASNSGVRDTFLSLRELAEVQTILILLNGQSPGSDRANKIFTMMEQQRPGEDLKDLILVGVGRFNQLPLENEGGERELDKLIDDAAVNTPLSETTVFEKLTVLKTTLDNTLAFTTQKDRIVLLDQLMGLADLAKRSSKVKAGSPEFLANLDYPGFLDQSKRMRQKWRYLSERLLESDPRSILGRQLGYFAQDGGIGKLRELIQTHVASHGLRQLHQDTRKAANVLRQQQNRLEVILKEIQEQGIPTTESQAFLDLRAAIENLDKTYRNFQKELGKEPLKDRRGVAVSDVVKDELTDRIFNWNEWTLLFNKAKNGTIILTKSKGAAGKLFERGNRADSSIPTKSDDFYPAFEKTVKELEGFARDRIRQAVIDLLNKLSNQVALERDHLKAILRPEMEQDIEDNFGTEEADLFYSLLQGYDPDQWGDVIVSEISNKDKPLIPETIFPLARRDEKHNIGQIFDWTPERRQTTSKPANHQFLILRLRDEITASANLHLVQYVSEVDQQVNSELSGILDKIIPSLQNLSKKEALLRYIAVEESGTDTAIPTWLQILSEISSIS
ncbi:dynamin family protein [Aerosakkonemataceae cyanobacterium BLCC-F50]|uniref:Dynamin family protein n=1 Tax=Floridaenema flaviceps BLCC-F50 TaxID=3153642 RepID=A0ABV4XIP7_9CYAN